MPDRPICEKQQCNNLARPSHLLKNGTRAYSSLCHGHATAHLKERHLKEEITPNVTPSCYSRPFRIWVDMRRRINDPSRPFYSRYGGRGIKYDPKWESFAAFWEDMGETYSQELTLDRIDNDGDYTKDNCRWADWSTQMNNRSYGHKITFNGKTMGINEWSRETGIKRTTIKERLRSYGWSIEKALTTGAK